MRYTDYSFRYGEEIMNSKFGLKKEILDIISKVKGKMNKNSAKRLNSEFEDLFRNKGWKIQSRAIDELGLTIDFEKERVGIEVQFGNVARLYADILKLQIMSFSGKDKIDVGIIILPKYKYSSKMGSAIANFEKITRELPFFKTALQVPLWIIGLEED